jgi:sugar lactone lactonase YvrE
MADMHVIVAGSRWVTEYDIVANAIESSGFHPGIACVISGAAKGVDALGEVWAHNNGARVRRFDPDWKKYGKRAGIL